MKCLSALNGSLKACLTRPFALEGRKRRCIIFKIRWECMDTDKDGFIPALLSAEITAKTGKDPGILYQELTGTW